MNGISDPWSFINPPARWCHVKDPHRPAACSPASGRLWRPRGAITSDRANPRRGSNQLRQDRLQTLQGVRPLLRTPPDRQLDPVSVAIAASPASVSADQGALVGKDQGGAHQVPAATRSRQLLHRCLLSPVRAASTPGAARAGRQPSKLAWARRTTGRPPAAGENSSTHSRPAAGRQPTWSRSGRLAASSPGSSRLDQSHSIPAIARYLTK